MGFGEFMLKSPDAGTFGSVRRAIDTRTNEARAVKHIPKNSAAHKERVQYEIEVMKTVTGKHQNIVEFVESFEDRNHFDLTFEFCEKGTLHDAIKAKRINEKAAAGFCHQILSALVFLKQNGVLHRDVKPANVLLKDQETSKLADFGSACFISEPKTLFNSAGTPAFFSPEMNMLPRGEGYSFPADVWATGVTLYMMLFEGKHPFAGEKDIDTNLVLVGAFDAGLLWLWNAKAAQMLSWLLMPCPRQRLDPQEACKHTWLGSYGFGPGSFTNSPPAKLVPDSYGRWGEDRRF